MHSAQQNTQVTSFDIQLLHFWCFEHRHRHTQTHRHTHTDTDTDTHTHLFASFSPLPLQGGACAVCGNPQPCRAKGTEEGPCSRQYVSTTDTRARTNNGTWRGACGMYSAQSSLCVCVCVCMCARLCVCACVCLCVCLCVACVQMLTWTSGSTRRPPLMTSSSAATTTTTRAFLLVVQIVCSSSSSSSHSRLARILLLSSSSSSSASASLWCVQRSLCRRDVRRQQKWHRIQQARARQ